MLATAAVTYIYDLKQFKPKINLFNQSVKDLSHLLLWLYMFSEFCILLYKLMRKQTDGFITIILSLLEIYFGWLSQEKKISIQNTWGAQKQASSWLLPKHKVEGKHVKHWMHYALQSLSFLNEPRKLQTTICLV